MAYTLTPNLRLRVDSNLTANAKFNLQTLDSLGAVVSIATTGDTRIRSELDLTFTANDASVGGSGSGGNVTFGQAGNPLDSFRVYADVVDFSTFSLADRAGGAGRLQLLYNSAAASPGPDSTPRSLTFDVQGGDRQLVLGGDLTTAGGSLTLNLSGASTLTAPTSGTLATLAGAEALTNKSMSGASNTFSNIGYSSLVLTGQVVNADVAAAAAIAGTKISPDFGNQLASADLGFRSKAGSFHATVKGATSSSEDVLFVLPPDNGVAGHYLITDGTGNTSWGVGGTGGQAATDWTSGTTFTFMHGLGTEDVQVSVYDKNTEADIGLSSVVRDDTNNITLTSSEAPSGAGWRVVVLSAGGTPVGVTSVGLAAPAEFTVSGSPVTAAGTLTLSKASQAANLVWAGPTSGGASAPTFRALVAADIPSLSGSYVSLTGAQSVGGLKTFTTPPAVSTLTAGQPLTLDGAKQLSTRLLVNADLDAAAAIAYSKLALTGQLVNADVSASAAIDYSKLSLTGQVVNADVAAGAAIAYSKLALTSSIVNADVSASAAIAYSKLNLSGSVTNADVNATAAISYSKLALTGSIINADVSASAAIAYSKLNLGNSLVNADVAAGAGILYSKLNLTGGIVNADVNAAAAIAYSKLSLASSIVNADVSASAAIAQTKLAPSVDYGDGSDGAATISSNTTLTRDMYYTNLTVNPAVTLDRKSVV